MVKIKTFGYDDDIIVTSYIGTFMILHIDVIWFHPLSHHMLKQLWCHTLVMFWSIIYCYIVCQNCFDITHWWHFGTSSIVMMYIGIFIMAFITTLQRCDTFRFMMPSTIKSYVGAVVTSLLSQHHTFQCFYNVIAISQNDCIAIHSDMIRIVVLSLLWHIDVAY